MIGKSIAQWSHTSRNSNQNLTISLATCPFIRTFNIFQHVTPQQKQQYFTYKFLNFSKRFTDPSPNKTTLAVDRTQRFWGAHIPADGYRSRQIGRRESDMQWYVGSRSHVVLIGQVKQYFAYESRHQHGAIDMTGGFKYSLFSPLQWGSDPIWRAYFSNGLVQPPTRGWNNSATPFPKAFLAFRHSAGFERIEAGGMLLGTVPPLTWLAGKPPIFSIGNTFFKRSTNFAMFAYQRGYQKTRRFGTK